MNASRHLEIVTLLTQVEEKEEIQHGLNELNSHLTSLVSQPSEASHQTNFAKSVSDFQIKINSLRSNFQPAQVKLLEEIGADKFFVSDMASEISDLVRENAATPAVAKQRLEKLVQDRENYLERINQLQENLVEVGVTINELEAGQAEIGFSLPRNLFDNEFGILQKELKVIERIVRAFSEATIGSVKTIEVRQISTSDPLFFLGYDIEVIKEIGTAFTWALTNWLIVEKIRKVRAETAEIESFKKDDPILKSFDEKIIKTISDATEEKVDELLKKIDNKNGRKNEQKTDLRWALDSIMSRVERGMTVEVRFLPPPIKEVKEGDEPAPLKPVYEELQKISSQLVFPKMEGDPILTLPASEPGEKSKVEMKKSDAKPNKNENDV